MRKSVSGSTGSARVAAVTCWLGMSWVFEWRMPMGVLGAYAPGLGLWAGARRCGSRTRPRAGARVPGHARHLRAQGLAIRTVRNENGVPTALLALGVCIIARGARVARDAVADHRGAGHGAVGLETGW